MATPFEVRTKRLVNSMLNQVMPNRTLVNNYYSTGLQSVAGVVLSVDPERRSVQMQDTSGTVTESFLQNRWVSKNNAAASVGSRVL